MKKIILLGSIVLSLIVQAGYLEEGYKYQEKGNYKKAEQMYLKAVQENDSVDAMTALGLLYYEQNKQDKSEEWFLKGVQNGSTLSMYHLGYLYYTQEKYDKAEEILLKNVEINLKDIRNGTFSEDRGDFAALDVLKYIYDEQKRYDKAEQVFLKVLKDVPSPTAMYYLGILYKDQKKYDKAKKYLKMAADIGNIYGAKKLYEEILEEGY